MKSATKPVTSHWTRMRRLYERFSARFSEFFGHPFQDFFDPVTGFDSYKFDIRFFRGNGTPLVRSVAERFGQAAADLLMEIQNAEANVLAGMGFESDGDSHDSDTISRINRRSNGWSEVFAITTSSKADTSLCGIWSRRRVSSRA